MAIWGLISLGLFGLGIYFVNLQNLWKSWIVSLCISYGFGWIVSLCLTCLMFIVLWIPCRDGKFDDGFKITYEDYECWAEQCDGERHYSSDNIVNSPKHKHGKHATAKYQNVEQNEDNQPIQYNRPVDYTYEI